MPAGKQDTHFYVRDAITYGSLTVLHRCASRACATGTRSQPGADLRQSSSAMTIAPRTYSGWSPRLCGVLDATPNLAFFADYTETWQAPVIDEQHEVQNSFDHRRQQPRPDAERIHAIRGGSVINLPDLLVSATACRSAPRCSRTASDEIFPHPQRRLPPAVDHGSIGGSCGDMPCR